MSSTANRKSNGFRKSLKPGEVTGEQYSWASFLPYTVKIGDGKWDTWALMSVGMFALAVVCSRFSSSAYAYLAMALLIASLVTSFLAVKQIRNARNTYGVSLEKARQAAPRGWVLSIAVLALSILNIVEAVIVFIRYAALL
ncbi:hypothetical protein CSQ87_06870 [Bifidobacterium simiarum]|uniref:Uncharacterized protein n=2 Tax=Bifidobacterium simiarum TaxID=2045441 RepID=A0A2M9HDR3_9BIFI|nr:hypothetical protein CSQ87_06870 [Bifidobacterium simiarum]